jgi:hypothetical protein
MPRWISDSGNQVFFETQESIVPQDTNSRWNVYEWERDGAGTCQLSPGCVYLLSGGGSTDDSFFLDAGANGNDVFFTSRENFVPPAQGETMKVYDARVDGGFSSTSTACTGSGCQGVPPALPNFAVPPTTTFSGNENFPPATTPGSTQKQTVTTKATSLSRALKACKRLSKRKRIPCERRARSRYAHKTKRGKR